MMVSFFLNGKSVSPDVAPGMSLLEYLRAENFFSVKYGCDQGECGACTVLVNGKAQNACLILMGSLAGEQVETLEGLNATRRMEILQAAFMDEGAIQCGYCTPAMLLALEALFRENPTPDETEIRDALAGIYCRCTGFVKPVAAALKIRPMGVTK